MPQGTLLTFVLGHWNVNRKKIVNKQLIWGTKCKQTTFIFEVSAFNAMPTTLIIRIRNFDLIKAAFLPLAISDLAFFLILLIKLGGNVNYFSVDVTSDTFPIVLIIRQIAAQFGKIDYAISRRPVVSWTSLTVGIVVSVKLKCELFVIWI